MSYFGSLDTLYAGVEETARQSSRTSRTGVHLITRISLDVTLLVRSIHWSQGRWGGLGEGYESYTVVRRAHPFEA